MGEVWRARHHMLARDAAIKLIQPDVLSRKSGNSAVLLRRRFEQEAKATALLRSPHTVELYDFGVTKDGVFYYVMELLDGIDLETLIKRFGPQPLARVVNILRQVCRSLADLTVTAWFIATSSRRISSFAGWETNMTLRKFSISAWSKS
jgi:serine/threonine-protein kinase